MIPAARLLAAIEILEEAEADPRPVDRVLEGYFRQRRYAGSKDRHAIRDRVYGILRRRARIDWHLERTGVVERPTARLRVMADLVLTDELTGKAVQELFSGEKHSPAVLGEIENRAFSALRDKTLDGDEAMPASVRLETPEWVYRRLEPVLGDERADALTAMGTEAPFDLRINPLHKADRNSVREALAKQDLITEPTPYSPFGLRSADRKPIDGLKLFKEGLIEVQDEGAQIAALLLGAAPGMQIADYCAGAGGKTLVMAGLMENKGRVLALDTSKGRLERCGVRTRRAGLHNVERHELAEGSDRRVKRLAGKFDRVMVDAPCSGTGTWRRNPDARWRYSEEDLAELTKLQAVILQRGARLVKPGGRLAYVTCSLLPEENEAIVDAFLVERGDEFRSLDIATVWNETVVALGGGACPVEGTHLRLTPHRHNTDGFFVQILERSAES
ncbi:MAG: RsmB/NOP family class I SAM-dependent RNA methyltransferase [Nisaea sp.]|uniref:RsmB/NOP family class I SAM-dependent RNA methyltransferase n=1 Tax=Nisaea sp. TaxID=2024842 RepID=UPI001B042CBB|nr:RsmB/NOP family class I SAM-dependent RNA methyltransferase [Nisaea sp.]MBO6560801.1 RsmB/NOP family class I SAM-dependent RNA methyltransferase [Nisaea sp.]